MIKEGKIGLQETIWLLIISITVKSYYTSPTLVAQYVGTASWLMTLISSVTAMFGFFLLCLLLKRFPGKDLVQIYELSMRRAAGFAFSVFTAIYLFIGAASQMREFAEITKIYTLPYTPVTILLGAFTLVSAAACYMGIETVARFARLTAYFYLAGFLVIIILSYNNYDYHNLFPIFGYGFERIVEYGLMRSSFYGEVIILAIIAGSLQGVEHIKKAGFTALAASGLFTATALCTTMMVFNYGVAQEVTSRMYAMTSAIHVGGFLQRLDPLFIFTWNIGSLVGITAAYYSSLSIYCKAFRIEDMRPLIAPSAILILVSGMLPPDLNTITEYIDYNRRYGWVVFFGLPAVSLMISAIRKKKGAAKGAK